MAKSRQQKKAERRQRQKQRKGESQAAQAAAGEPRTAPEPAEAPDERPVEREAKREAKRAPAPARRTEERRRGRVLGFFVSCWQELRRVQWPDRENLVQASAVTLLFVAIMAAYLGGLDFVFNRLVQALL